MSIKIERVANGYEVCLTDPEIVKKNSSASGRWKNPEVEYVFKTVSEVMSFLEKNLDKAMPEGDYESSFAIEAAKEEDD